MAEGSSVDRSWLLEPPGPGQVRIHLEAGEGVELDQSQRDALETLVTSFYQEEVAGHALWWGDCEERCRPLSCEPRIRDCAADFCGKFSCDVGVFPTGLIA